MECQGPFVFCTDSIPSFWAVRILWPPLSVPLCVSLPCPLLFYPSPSLVHSPAFFQAFFLHDLHASVLWFLSRPIQCVMVFDRQ